MIDYDSFSRCHLTDIFFAIFAGAKESNQDIMKLSLTLTLNEHLHTFFSYYSEKV